MGKIHKLRNERLREVEAPWLVNLWPIFMQLLFSYFIFYSFCKYTFLAFAFRIIM